MSYHLKIGMRGLIPLTLAWLAMLLFTLPSHASDKEVAYPSGWLSSGISPSAESVNGFATTAYQYDSKNSKVIDRSLVIQDELNGTSYFNEFEGKVFALEYSASGDHLLVHEVGSEGMAPGNIRIHLLSNSGQVLWSKDEASRMFFFSSSGEVVYAWWPGDYNPEDRGRKIEVFDLAGESIHEVTFDHASVRGVVVPSDGQNVIVVTTRSITKLHASKGEISVEWRTDVPTNYPDVVNVSSTVGNGRFVAQLGGAAALVVNLSGAIDYAFDPQALGESDPWLGASKYAAYRMHTGLSAGKLLLFNGSSAAMELDLTSLDLTRKALNTRSPGKNYSGPVVHDRHLAFFSSDSVVLRERR